MRGEFMDLAQAAAHVHVDMNELKHVAQRGEIDAVLRAGEWYFDHADLDEWAQRHLLSSGRKNIAAQHRSMTEKRRREKKSDIGVASLLHVDAIDVAIAAKAKAGMVRDMTDLAERTGLVYNPEDLFRELMAREEAASTAIGAGVAFLHPKYHDPYFFEESFIAYGRSERPIFFGAPDGAGTRHFFLICVTDHELHLHVLARLAILTHGTDLLERLDAAEDAEGVIAAIRDCEAEFLR